MNEEPFLIPIDDSIQDFLHHLDTHDRTIFSARFGDGKTFFLSHFMEDDDVKERYTFLTIFPVNYQVTGNRDIFELIKRDILLQMLIKGVIETEIEVNNDIALALYLQCQPLGFVESFLPLLSEQPFNGEIAKTAAFALAGKKFFKSIKQKIDGFKQQSRDSLLDAFFNAVEHNPVVGQDAISSIIQQCLKQYRGNHPNKKVVLVIEDLDRIDPAHLFRILNIFSAHMDFCYRFGNRPDESLVGNKFDLDKVVFVMHYENVKTIYHHFYGAETYFDGYIEKFCSSNHFTYSLEAQRERFFYGQIEKETEIGMNLLNYILTPNDFKDKSIRKVVNSIENSSCSVIENATAQNNGGKAIRLHTGILKLIAILRKLDISDSEIVSRLKRTIETKGITNKGLFAYLAPYINLSAYKNARGDMRFIKAIDRVNTFHVDDINESGKALCSFSTVLNNDESSEERLLKLLKKVMLMVTK